MGGFLGDTLKGIWDYGQVNDPLGGIDPLHIFDVKKKPTVPDAPAAPTIANSQDQLDAADQEMARRMQRGRTSTILNGAAGFNDSQNTSHVLLGS